MPTLPALDVKTKMNHSPHVVLLGAGTSIASAIRNSERSGMQLPGMQDLVAVIGLQELMNKHGVEYQGENFELFYDRLVASNEQPELVTELESKIYDYFSRLELPDEATIYDYLVLSLREKDIIATFNWDPFLAQAFARNMNFIGYEHMPKLAFLHGNVAIGVCYECNASGWCNTKCISCGKRLQPSKLLYPVGRKNYTNDPFIKSEWDHLRAHLKHAYYITIFGYSAPKTDQEARRLLLEEWLDNQTRELAEIDIVDILASTNRAALKANWQEFFVRTHYGLLEDVFRSASFTSPRRSCESFAMATLQQDPWEDNKFPQGVTLEELQNWVLPLVDEEKEGKFSGKTCQELGGVT